MHARDWLFSLESIGIKLGLSQVTRLLEFLGQPQHAFPSITIAGTNGKGSVTAMIERGLRAAGRRTGRYTSPHLLHIEERIVVDGLPISPEAFDHLAAQVRQAATHLDAPPSFFEATTALALVAFRDAGVDVAVLEVGLGGRLDATNAVDSPLVAITAIDLDHQEHLGSSIEAIAREKAGIIKPGATVVVGPNPLEAVSAIQEVSQQQGATLIDATSGVSADAAVTARESVLRLTTPLRTYGACRLSLAGRHQVANALVAVRVLESVQPAVTAAAIRTALEDVAWPARLEWLRWAHGEVLIDGAHNPAGARALTSFLQEMVSDKVPLVLGVMRDKAAAEIVAALAPVASAFVTTAATSPRALPADALADLCRTAAPSVPVITTANPKDALIAAREVGGPVVVAGSLYLAGEVRGIVVSGA